MSDVFSKEVRSRMMSKIRGTNTKLEIAVRKYLFSCGLRYRKNDKRFPGHPDIILPKYKTAIFINGCFWHMHEGCKKAVLPKSNTEFWLSKLERNRERDALNTALLKQSGWNVIRVWECELGKKTITDRLTRLLEEIKQAPEKPNNLIKDIRKINKTT